MKFTDEWLKEYCPNALSPERLSALLTGAGIKVEGVTQAGDDWCFELELTANRPDCLGLIGVAREVALLVGGTLQAPAFKLALAIVGHHDQVPIRVEDPAGCPRYTGRVIRGVQIRPSPAWLQRRLTGIGLRPVNNVVDVTNYVLFECGQPLHAFDLARLRGPELRIRLATKGEKLRAIDDREYALEPNMLVIADRDAPVAIAGVMGGKETEVVERTTDLLLESACFHPHSIRRTSRRLALSSASSYRFERGVDPERVVWASRRAAELIADLAGGVPDGGLVDLNHTKTETRTVVLRLPRLERILGLAVGADAVQRILAGLGLEPRPGSAGEIVARIPSSRIDLAIEEDLIEEIARIHGYDKIPASPKIGMTVAREGKIDFVRKAARTALVGCGLREVLTTSFAEAEEIDDFPFWSKDPAVAALNPQGGVEKHLRRSLVPAMLRIACTNEGYAEEGGAYFEIAQAYVRAAGGEPGEVALVSLLDRAGFHALQGAWEVLLERLGLAGAWGLEAADLPGLAPGRSAQVRLQGRPIGVIGEIDRRMMEKYGLRQPVAVLEADFGALLGSADLERRYRPFSRYPGVTRDLAVVFPEAVTWEQIKKRVRSAGVEHLEAVRFFDLYRGKGIGPGEKSVAFRLTFRADDRTLTGEEADASVKRVMEALAGTFQGRQR